MLEYYTAIKRTISPASVVQWVGHCPVNLKVTGSIPGQGTCLDCGLGPQLGAWKRHLINVCLAHQSFSSSRSPFLPLSLKINKNLKKNKLFIVSTIWLTLKCIILSERSQSQKVYILHLIPFVQHSGKDKSTADNRSVIAGP